jgi:TPR repeat protein
LEQAAAAGDAQAAYNLGLLLVRRLDPPDLPAARRAYEQAAAAGNIDAGINLGALLAFRLDSPDLPSARRAFEQATAWAVAEQQQLRVSSLDLRMHGVTTLSFFGEMAAAARHMNAAFGLGVILADKLDPPDLLAARDAYEQAAAWGHAGAVANLAKVLGAFYPDPLAVRRTYEEEAAKGGTAAAFNLGLLLTHCLDPPDFSAARHAFEQAAAAGHIGAAFELGQLLAERLDPPDLPGARNAYEQAAASG